MKASSDTNRSEEGCRFLLEASHPVAFKDNSSENHMKPVLLTSSKHKELCFYSENVNDIRKATNL